MYAFLRPPHDHRKRGPTYAALHNALVRHKQDLQIICDKIRKFPHYTKPPPINTSYDMNEIINPETNWPTPVSPARQVKQNSQELVNSAILSIHLGDTAPYRIGIPDIPDHQIKDLATLISTTNTLQHTNRHNGRARVKASIRLSSSHTNNHRRTEQRLHFVDSLEFNRLRDRLTKLCKQQSQRQTQKSYKGP